MTVLNPLPREEAKRRILELVRERADRSRYIIAPPEERSYQDLPHEMIPRREERP